MTQRRRQRTRGRSPISLIWLFILTVLLAFTGTAAGQQGDNVRPELERTDELLENAKDLISNSGAVAGRAVLEQAFRNQRNAWDSFGRGRWGMALQLTIRAREDMYRALGTLRQSDSNDDEVEKQLERTDLVLEGANDRLQPGTGIALRRSLESALTMQRRAWDLFREKNLRPALRLTLEARQMVLRMGSDHDRGTIGGRLDEATFEARFNRLSEGIERLEDRMSDGDNSDAQNHVDKARTALNSAREAFDKGDIPRADHGLNTARRELERAMRLVVADVRSEELSTLIESAEDRLDLISSSVDGSGDSRMQELLDQARAGLEQARAALAEGRNQRALFQTRRAVDLLNRIADEVGL